MIVLSRSKKAAGRPPGAGPPVRPHSCRGWLPSIVAATVGKGRATIVFAWVSARLSRTGRAWLTPPTIARRHPPSRRRGPGSSPQEPGPAAPGHPPARGRPLLRPASVHSRAGSAGRPQPVRRSWRPDRARPRRRAMTSPALLITRDELLLDDLLRLAAAAGTTLDVAHDAGGGAARPGPRRRSCWSAPTWPRRWPPTGPPVATRCTSSVTDRRTDELFRGRPGRRGRRRRRAAGRRRLAGRAAHRRGRRRRPPGPDRRRGRRAPAAPARPPSPARWR